MLTLDFDGILAKTISPTHGISEQDFTDLTTTMRRHTEAWLRERREGMHAWSMDPYAKRTIERVRETADRLVRKEKISTVLWIGIGGSGLGPRMLAEAFEKPDTVEFHVIDSIDPSVLEMVLRIINWDETAIVVACKSGSTLETMSTFFLFWEALKKARKGKAKHRVVAITDPRKGPLRTFCLEQSIECLSIPPDVGGRYSIFSPIGLLALALLRADIDAFVRGAKTMDELCQESSLSKNPAALLAACQFLLEQKKKYSLRVIMPYAARLRSIAHWNQQLIAESLGKNEAHNPIPFAAQGTQDQHSLLQQWLSGPRSFWHLFIRERAVSALAVPATTDPAFAYLAGKPFSTLLSACADGTTRALTEMKRPSITITLDIVDEEHCGQLLFLLLTETVLLGKLYRIDPYGQPSVEIGKTITKDILLQ